MDSHWSQSDSKTPQVSAYSGRSQQYGSLDDLGSSPDSHLF